MLRNNPQGGFTLVELLVVITVIVVLASIALPVFTNTQERARATQDMSNLRQLGIATQMYMNDNDNVIFSADPSAGSWMVQLHPKYLGTWKIFQSAFDKRSPLEDNANAPVSYGLNGHTSPSVLGYLAEKITNSSGLILFAPAQNDSTPDKFSGKAGGSNITVLKNTSVPGGTVNGGTHNGRKRINAVFADLHTESLEWSRFKNDQSSSTDKNAPQRWDPSAPPSP